jgi:hypothetical protein
VDADPDAPANRATTSTRSGMEETLSIGQGASVFPVVKTPAKTGRISRRFPELPLWEVR